MPTRLTVSVEIVGGSGKERIGMAESPETTTVPAASTAALRSTIERMRPFLSSIVGLPVAASRNLMVFGSISGRACARRAAAPVT